MLGERSEEPRRRPAFFVGLGGDFWPDRLDAPQAQFVEQQFDARRRWRSLRRSCRCSRVVVCESGEGDEFVVDAKRRELYGDIRDSGLCRAKAGAQDGEVGQAPGVEIRRNRLGEFGFAGALVRQGEKLDRDLAGVANIAALLQRVEDAPVGGAGNS